MTLLLDTREPWPHPWPSYWPDVAVERATLETGDVCLAANPGVVVERKEPSDLIAVLTAGRERFERELKRATHLDSFIVVVAGSLEDCLLRRRGLHVNSIVGTLAAWQRRYRIPFVFMHSDKLAADFALRYLTQPVREAERLIAACAGLPRGPDELSSARPVA